MPRISVSVRIRPVDSSESLNSLTFLPDQNLIDIDVSNSKQEFHFDKVFGPNANQENIFNDLAKPLVDQLLEGYNGCIFAYGQTGAGKTHTMMSYSIDNQESQGICIRVAEYLFKKSFKMKDNLAIRLSVLEIYNETMLDLLVEQVNQIPNFGSSQVLIPSTQKLSVVDTANGVIIPGLRIQPLSSYDDALNYLVDAQANRAVAEHQLNRKSSRSHVITTYYITRTKVANEQLKNSDPEVIQSKIHLVDLAGSERVNKTGSVGTIQKEANHINKSLSFLEQVVLALAKNKREHVPFRQSKLTYLLKDSLGGNCNTYMIACIWPHKDHSWESLSTLRFGTRMKCIETHPVRNRLVSSEPISSKLLHQLDALKKELIMRDQIFGRDSWMPDLSSQQKLKAFKDSIEIASYPPPAVNSNEDISISNLEVNSLSHLSLIMGVFKAALWESCENDPSKVEKMMKKTLILRNSSISEKIEKLFLNQIPDESENSTQVDKRKFLDLMDQSLKEDKQNESLSNYNKEIIDEKLDIARTNINVSVSELTKNKFEEFKNSKDVANLNKSYEESKRMLKVNKDRQREIIGMLNNQKTIIDSLTIKISEIDSNNESSNDESLLKKRNEFETELLQAKQSYRSAHSELKYCKEQVAEIQALKKRLMASMVTEYEKHGSSET